MEKVTSDRHFKRAKKGFLLDIWIFIYLHVWISVRTRVRNMPAIFLAVLKFPKRLKVNIHKKRNLYNFTVTDKPNISLLFKFCKVGENFEFCRSKM